MSNFKVNRPRKIVDRKLTMVMMNDLLHVSKQNEDDCNQPHYRSLKSKDQIPSTAVKAADVENKSNEEEQMRLST